jgi:hypothetical protein
MHVEGFVKDALVIHDSYLYPESEVNQPRHMLRHRTSPHKKQKSS